ncbi:site-specific DNA-methyltransferase [Parendozoicomonas sp. Alg238-R29]|uniref:site-specific DNA-methyltransferase n=1 Tax=Parendozoicomonas sp. Alg238-R29 TaxID=2993446 RepID=UPI00248EAA42|nr:site-specific DNA-methyltransferase [Parendozoicomonas sp. Alg238-R29]
MNEIEEISRKLGFMPIFKPFSEKREVCFSSSDASCILLKGDNEDALNLLQSDFLGSVDFCYIDPPYNTKNSFIYDDKRITKEPNLFGSHAAWMQFMLNRLVLAKKLLSETGIIAISIDDYEQPYLRLLMDQIFDESNFITNITVARSKNGKGSSSNNVAVNHEYVVLYGKSKKSKVLGLDNSDDSLYNKEDLHGKFKIDGLFRKKGEHSLREDRPNLFYPLYFDTHGHVYTEKKQDDFKTVYPIDSKGIERRWLWGLDKAKSESWKLYASPKGVVYVKNYFTPEKRVKIRSLWDDNRYLTERATNEIKEIYGVKVFDTPKPIGLIEDLIYSCTNEDSIIIDFFAGTGTTAHAAYNLNSLYNEKRKTILVESCSEIPVKHTAWKKGYRNISDITSARLKWLSDQDCTFIFQESNV